MCQPVVRGHADESFHGSVDVMVFGISSGELPVGFRSQGEVGDIVIFHSVIARDDGAALSIGCQALHGTHACLLYTSHPAIQEKIDELVDRGIPVVTVNTDIFGSKRMAYVGSDYICGGRTAAGLLALMTEGETELGIITGSRNVLCHSERIRGLTETLEASYPRIHIAEILENHDDEFESYALTRQLLRQNPHIDALFFAAAGVFGGCKAIQESGRHPKIVTFDEVPTTLDLSLIHI